MTSRTRTVGGITYFDAAMFSIGATNPTVRGAGWHHFNTTTSVFEVWDGSAWVSMGGGVTDHGALSGLADDDHTQYHLTDGTRAMTGDLNMGANNITPVALVDGRDVATDGTKLDGIEASATADQTDAEIETAYNAQVAQVSAGEKTAGTEVAIRRFAPLDIADMAGTHGGGGGDHGGLTGLGDDDHTQYHLTDGTRAMSGDLNMGANNITPVALVDGRDVATDGTKLDGIEAAATADQSNAEIETAYNAQVAQISAGEKTLGTELAVRRFAPDDVTDMIAIHESASVTDHGALTGLTDDDHTQYYKSGGDTLTGTMDVSGELIDNVDVLNTSLTNQPANAVLNSNVSTRCRWSTMIANSVLGQLGGGPVGVTLSTDSVLGRIVGVGGGNLGARLYHDIWEALAASSSAVGTSFPSTPPDGMLFYHQTHDEHYAYNTALSAWISLRSYQLTSTGLESPTSYTLMPGHSTSLRFSATNGWVAPFDLVCMTLSLWSFGTATTTVFVQDDGANVTSASVALASAKKAVVTNIQSATIAASSIVGFEVTSGNPVTAYTIVGQFHRIET